MSYVYYLRHIYILFPDVLSFTVTNLYAPAVHHLSPSLSPFPETNGRRISSSLTRILRSFDWSLQPISHFWVKDMLNGVYKLECEVDVVRRLLAEEFPIP